MFSGYPYIFLQNCIRPGLSTVSNGKSWLIPLLSGTSMIMYWPFPSLYASHSPSIVGLEFLTKLAMYVVNRFITSISSSESSGPSESLKIYVNSLRVYELDNCSLIKTKHYFRTTIVYIEGICNGHINLNSLVVSQRFWKSWQVFSFTIKDIGLALQSIFENILLLLCYYKYNFFARDPVHGTPFLSTQATLPLTPSR